MPPTHESAPSPSPSLPWLFQRRTRAGTSFAEIVLDTVSVDDLLAQTLAELDVSGVEDDPDTVVLPGQPLPDDNDSSNNPIPAIPKYNSVDEIRLDSPISPSVLDYAVLPFPTANPTSLSEPRGQPRRNGKKGTKRRIQRAAAVKLFQEASPLPHRRPKTVGRKRISEAKRRAICVDVDAADLPHAKPAWTGHRNAPQRYANLIKALNGFDFAQDGVADALKEHGMQYVDWRNGETIPILDRMRRCVALLGGHPREWEDVTEDATGALEELAPRIRLTDAELAHRRAKDKFPALGCGVSHGGGQLAPGELLIHGENKQVTDALLQHHAFKRIVGFTNYLFLSYMPLLYFAYEVANAALGDWAPALRWPFAGSVFAACTFNFVSTVCAPHVDFGNLAWGWCAITALGRFNPDRGGHLILWALRLVIRFPPGSVIFIPSALLLHSNSPIQDGDTRSSFVQYSAGGLFRWVDQGFQTQKEFERTATKQAKAEAKARREKRWEEGMKYFTVFN